MTTQQASDKLKGVATVWQLVVSISTTVIAILSVGSVIVVVLAFAFSLRADVNSSLRETTRDATDIIEVKDELHRHEEKVDVIQRQILDAQFQIAIDVHFRFLDREERAEIVAFYQVLEKQELAIPYLRSVLPKEQNPAERI